MEPNCIPVRGHNIKEIACCHRLGVVIMPGSVPIYITVPT